MKAVQVAPLTMLLLTGASAFGEEVSKPEAVDEIVITATRTALSAREIPASTSVVTSDDIQKRHVLKPEEALKGLVGIDSTSSNPGGFAGSPRLRGLSGSFAGSTTQYLVDGLPVEPPLISNRQAWLLISPQEIDRIEVVRGPASSLYGPGAVAGVINIIPKKGRGAPTAEVAAGAGDFSSYRLTASSSGSFLERFDYSVGANLYWSGGYKPLPDAASTPLPWRDYYPAGYYDIQGRDQTDKKVSVSLGYRPTDSGQLSASFRYYDIDGAWLGGHPNYRWAGSGRTADLGYRWRLSDLAELKAKLLWASFHYRSTFDKNTANGDGDLGLDSSDLQDESAWDAELQGDFHFLPANTLTLGASYNWGNLATTSDDAAGVQFSSSSSKSQVGGVYLQDQHKFGEAVVATVGGRYDRYRFYGDVRNQMSFAESHDDVLTYRAGLRVNPSKATSLYASLGTAYLPALNDLKFRSGTSWLNNPDLKPERSTSYEVGLEQDLWRAARAKAALYYTDYRDRITAVDVATAGAPKRQYQNLGQVTVKGAELSLDAIIADCWRPYANYTYTGAVIAKDPSNPRAEGKTPAYTPKHKVNAGVVYDNPKLFMARLEARFVGDQYFDNLETPTARAGGHMVVDAKISREFPFGGALRSATVSLAANNLLNRMYTEWSYERVMGLNFWAELAAQF